MSSRQHERNEAAGTSWGSCHKSEIDFTEITKATPGEIVAEARAACASCPVLLGCLRYLEGTDVAGFAGGMFQVDRKRWQRRHHYAVETVGIEDVSEAHELRGPIVDDVSATPDGGTGQRLTPKVTELVFRMTRAGFSAEEIVARLAMPRITHRTIKYLRNRYQVHPWGEAIELGNALGARRRKAG